MTAAELYDLITDIVLVVAIPFWLLCGWLGYKAMRYQWDRNAKANKTG